MYKSLKREVSMNPRDREPRLSLSQLSPDLNPLFRAKPGGGAPAAGPPHRDPDPEAAEEEAPRLRLANPGSSFGPLSAVSCGGGDSVVLFISTLLTYKVFDLKSSFSTKQAPVAQRLSRDRFLILPAQGLPLSSSAATLTGGAVAALLRVEIIFFAGVK